MRTNLPGRLLAALATLWVHHTALVVTAQRPQTSLLGGGAASEAPGAGGAAGDMNNTELVLVNEFWCESSSGALEKTLLLRLEGSGTSSWWKDNQERISLLESTVRATYNNLSFEACDQPYFRSIRSVKVLVDYRVNKDTETLPTRGEYAVHNTSIIALEIKGVCRNCTDSNTVSLFDRVVVEETLSLDNPNTTTIVPSIQTTGNNPNTTTTVQTTDTATTVSSIQESEGTTSTANTTTVATSKQQLLSDLEVDGPASLCLCASDTATTTTGSSNNENVTSNRPPVLTEANFLSLLSLNLARQAQELLQEDEDAGEESPVVAGVVAGDLQELQEVPCGTNVRTFTSLVFVDLNLTTAANNQVVSKAEIRALGQSFLDAYNWLAFENCDPYFRRVVDVVLEIEVSSNNDEEDDEDGDTAVFANNVSMPTVDIPVPLSPDNGTKTTTNSSLPVQPKPQRHGARAVLTIEATCQNCHVDMETGSFTLFDYGAPTSTSVEQRRRRHLKSFQDYQRPIYAPFGPPEKTFTDTDSCICPTNSASELVDLIGMAAGENITLATPVMSVGDFLGVYNTYLKELNASDDGSTATVESADRLEEAKKVQCGATLQNFTTEVFSDLRVNTTSLTREEVRLLEQAFADTYNRVAYQTCDGLFRTISNVELRVAPVGGRPSRRLQEVNSTVNAQYSLSNSTFNNTINVNSTTANNYNYTTGGTEDGRHSEIVPTLFAVVGECRECPVTQAGTFNLFDGKVVMMSMSIGMQQAYVRTSNKEFAHCFLVGPCLLYMILFLLQTPFAGGGVCRVYKILLHCQQIIGWDNLTRTAKEKTSTLASVPRGKTLWWERDRRQRILKVCLPHKYFSCNKMEGRGQFKHPPVIL